MVKVVIDGKEVEVEPGTTILEVAKRLGIKIPTLCYYPGVFGEATCRICVVEIVGSGRMAPSCVFPVSEGLTIKTDSDSVRESRRLALEAILAIHRIKCQSCLRKGGNCELLQLCKEYGVEGIPVCAECPLHEDDCLLSSGELCLGPLTIAGCGGICMYNHRVCEGCRGPVTRSDVVEEAVKLYDGYGVSMEDILTKLGKYYASHPQYETVVKLITEFFERCRRQEVWG